MQNRVLLLLLLAAVAGVAAAVHLEDVAKAEDDGTMTSVAAVGPGLYRVTAPNHDSYVRFTMPTGCHDLSAFAYLKMKAWAAPGVQFTVDLRQGFDDCRLDAWPYVRDSASALVSHYTAAGAFNGAADGQDVWIPMAHFPVDRAKIAQVFVSSVVTVGSPAATTVQFGPIEFTNEAPPRPPPPPMPQNPTTFNCARPYTLAITFDNQHSGNLGQILDTLKANNAKCTVFQIGGDLVENDAAMKRLIQEGHQVAAHTWTHPDLLELSEDAIRREMTLTDAALQARLGVRTRWFRPPFGHQDPRVRAVLNDLGYVSVIWNVDSTDYFNQENGPVVWARIQARLDAMDPSRTGGVVLLHNDIKTSADLVGRVIAYARGRGFRDFVTMDECMAGQYDVFLGRAPGTSAPSSAPVAVPPTDGGAATPAPPSLGETENDAPDKHATSGAMFGSGVGLAVCTALCVAVARYIM